jgi:hypothetical protein
MWLAKWEYLDDLSKAREHAFDTKIEILSINKRLKTALDVLPGILAEHSNNIQDLVRMVAESQGKLLAAIDEIKAQQDQDREAISSWIAGAQVGVLKRFDRMEARRAKKAKK